MQAAGLASSQRKSRRAPIACATCPLNKSGDCPASDNFQGSRLKRASSKHLDANTDVYSGLGAPDTVSILQSGWVFQYAHLASGGRQILTFLVRGDIFDQDAVILTHSPSLFAFRTLTDATICQFDMEEYRALLTADVRSRHFAKRQIRRHQELIAKHMISIGRRRALARVAGLLLEFKQRLSETGLVEDNTMPFPLRQEDIADALGLTHAHVNRTLKSLREAGMIEYDHTSVRFLNLPALHAQVPNFVPRSA